jgi:hypothetical protein
MKHAIRILLIGLLLFPGVRVKEVIIAESSMIVPAISFEEFMRPVIVEEKPELVDITITRFFPNDETGADKCMATMCISKLKLNSKGWYTYEGKVVIAAATYACQARCKNRAKYGPLPSDYRIYNFYDEIQFVIENITYTGIVLDSCGACMYHINGEALQRYDIYTASGNKSSSLLSSGNAGKIKAQLLVTR